MHDIALPALAGVAEGEPAPVGGDGFIGMFVEESFAREQAVHGRTARGGWSMPRSRAVLMRALTDSAGCSVLSETSCSATSGGRRRGWPRSVRPFGVQGFEAA